MRTLLITAAIALVFGAVAAQPAEARTYRRHAVVHHTTMHHTTMRHAARPARVRDGGSAAVDALNDQALARARGTAQ